MTVRYVLKGDLCSNEKGFNLPNGIFKADTSLWRSAIADLLLVYSKDIIKNKLQS